MLWETIEMEYPNIKPDSIPDDVYDEWETRFNDLMAEIKEWYENLTKYNTN